MGFTDKIDYLNPMNAIKGVLNVIYEPVKKQAGVKATQTGAVRTVNVDMAKVTGNMLIKFAGLSGATAVAMGAYGSHAFYRRPDVPDELKEVYRTANYYHFLHTIALLAVPLTKRPLLVGALMATGMSLFCGTCYSYALTGHKPIGKLAPYGGTLLIIAWLSMLF